MVCGEGYLVSGLVVGLPFAGGAALDVLWLAPILGVVTVIAVAVLWFRKRRVERAQEGIGGGGVPLPGGGIAHAGLSVRPPAPHGGVVMGIGRGRRVGAPPEESLTRLPLGAEAEQVPDGHPEPRERPRDAHHPPPAPLLGPALLPQPDKRAGGARCDA